MPVLTTPIGPAWTYADPAVTQDPFAQEEAVPSTTVSAAVNVATLTGTQPLSVVSTAGFPSSGTLPNLVVPTNTGSAVISYTGTTGTSFTDCTLIAGSGTIAAGAQVLAAFSGSGSIESAIYWSTSQNCAVQLSDGTCVFLYYSVDQYVLVATILGKTDVQVIGSYPTLFAGIGASFCICADASDNIYVVQGLQGQSMGVWLWQRDTSNNSWSVTEAGALTDASALWTPFSMVWTTDGHLIISTEQTLLPVDTSSLLLGTPVTGLKDCPRVIAASSFGDTTGVVVSTTTDGTTFALYASEWSISGGTISLSSASSISTTATPGGAAGTPGYANTFAFAPHVHATGSGVFAVIFIDKYKNIHAVAVNASLAHSTDRPMPALVGAQHQARQGLGFNFGSYSDPTITNRAWVVMRGSNSPGTILRVGMTINTSGPTLAWDFISLPIATGVDTTGQSIVCPQNPVTQQVDVLMGAVPSAATTFCVSGTWVLPTYVPAAPLLVSPSYGQVADPTASIEFEWVVDPGEDQDEVAFVVYGWAGGGSMQWWTGTPPSGAGEWTEFEFWTADAKAAGAVGSLTIPASSFLGAGAAYGWTVLTRAANGLGSGMVASQVPFPLKVSMAAAPSVVASVASSATSLPTINWTFTIGTSGAGQASWQVLVGPSDWNPATDTPLFATPVTPGPAASYTMVSPDYLVEGTAYDIYVVVTDILGASNGYVDFVPITPSYSVPATLTLSATGPSDGSGVALATTGGTSSNFAEFQFSFDATTWYDVRGAGPGQIVIASGIAAVIDNDMAGAGTTIYYRARQITSAGLVSAWSLTSIVTIAAWTGYWWLKDLANPANNAKVQVKPPWSKPVNEVSSAYTVLGGTLDVVVSDNVRGPTGNVTFITGAVADYGDLYALLVPSRTLLLTSPFGDWYYVWLTGPRDFEAQYPTGSASLVETTCKYVNVVRPP